MTSIRERVIAFLLPLPRLTLALVPSIGISTSRTYTTSPFSTA
jgi:hypothetical protein